MSTPARVRLTIAPATGQLRFSLRPAPRLQFTLRRGGNASAGALGIMLQNWGGNKASNLMRKIVHDMVCGPSQIILAPEVP